MVRETISVAEAVRDIVYSKPFLIDMICMDVANYSALARALEQEVSKIIGRKASVDAIKIALLRFKDRVCTERRSMSKS